MLKTGDLILVAHRRLFAEDQSRFFTGKVNEHEHGVVMAAGHSWVRDAFSGEYIRSNSERSKIFSLIAGSLIVYVLPVECHLDDLRMLQLPDQALMLCDGHGFKMDLSERHPNTAERRVS